MCLLWIPISTGSARNKVHRRYDFFLMFYDDKRLHIIRLVWSDSAPKQHSRLGETMLSEADPFRVQKCTFRAFSDPLPDAFHDLFPLWKQLRFVAAEATAAPQSPARKHLIRYIYSNVCMLGFGGLAGLREPKNGTAFPLNGRPPELWSSNKKTAEAW